MKWQAVIGLEVHAELNTKSKMYCGCKNEFGGEPNSRCCPVCTGMPGALPQLNKAAVESAILAGLAMNAQITQNTRQYRKNYFYPDLPKGYQISQFSLPLCVNGVFSYVCDGQVLQAHIRQIHIEEDAGKLIHTQDGETQIDYNRCGVPLIEIVTQPDFHSAKQARAFLEAVKVMLIYLGISDCRMQEGSLRCDVNVSLRPEGSDELMPRVEMKNINTFSGAERAIEYEIVRQKEMLQRGENITQETRRWDDERRTSFLLRNKENTADYRYFPEPDIPAILISDSDIMRIGEMLPELATAKFLRCVKEYGLTDDTAMQLSSDHAWACFFDSCMARGADAKACANMILGTVSECANESGVKLSDSGLTDEAFAEIINKMIASEISASAAKKAVAYLYEKGGSAEDAVDILGLKQISDSAYLEEIVNRVLEENPRAVDDYAAGKKSAMGFLTGQAMKMSRGRANPRMLGEILEKCLEGRV